MIEALILLSVMLWFGAGFLAACKSAGWTSFNLVVAVELLLLGPIGLMIAIARGRQ